MDNQKPGPSKRLERAKSDLLPSRSTEKLKNKIRQKFADRLRISRSKSVDQLRKIIDEIDVKHSYETFCELRALILGFPEPQFLVSETEMNSLMDEIEQELEYHDNQRRVYEQELIFQLETENVLKDSEDLSASTASRGEEFSASTASRVEEYSDGIASRVTKCCFCEKECGEDMCDSCREAFESPFL